MIGCREMATRQNQPSSHPFERQTRIALAAALEASNKSGAMLRKHLNGPKKINEAVQHDIKLELDVRSQALIEKHLFKALPEASFLGEEGEKAPSETALRWVVDPIDGTVNFAYGIPHACISIALQVRSELMPGFKTRKDEDHLTLMGLIHDPFCNETWTATLGGPARLNGKVIRVSPRRKLAEAIVAMGFSKSEAKMRQMLPVFQALMPRIRKIRMMGAAALDLVYVACGRMDAYLEGGVRLWDIAAGGLIVERAGGRFWRERLAGDEVYRVMATNGTLHAAIHRTTGFGGK